MKKKKLYCSIYNPVKDMDPYLKKKLKGHALHIHNEALTTKNLDTKTEVLGVFVDSTVTKETIKSLPKLKLIVTLSTGYDHIDLMAAKKAGIPVCNVPNYGQNTVAEFTLALILALSRKIFPAVKRVKEGIYDYHGLRGFDIKGKTVGIIGVGHIGLNVIGMLKGFQANVIAYDRSPKKELEKEYEFAHTSMETLVKTSDIISLHVPLFPSTKHMIDKKTLRKMKKGVYIINTARGGLIDPEALVWGLENGHVGGAGLDVFEQEDIMSNPEQLVTSACTPDMTRIGLMNNLIVDHPNTIVTPHNAFNTTEALQRIIDTATEHINSFAAEKLTYDLTKK